MRIIVISNLYPPISSGGYEVECSGVVERLRGRHEVLVLTSNLDRARTGTDPDVRRDLRFLADDWRGALRAPLAAMEAARTVRAALRWAPDLIYAWNLSSTPQASLRMLADAGVPVALRICSHLLSGLFVKDQFMRELIPGTRTPARSVWSHACRGLNMLRLRLRPEAPLRVAVSWNSEAIRRMVEPPAFVDLAFERVEHSVPRFGELYESVDRDPAPMPEIVFLGRVTEFKGLSVAIEALAQLRSAHGIPARLVVIGPEDGQHGAEMRTLAERLGVGRDVLWRGQASAEQAAAALARAHALIVPSLWAEPFPLVTIEAAFARVPIVASDVGGIGEGMRADEHALLFPRGDVAAAAVALARTFTETEETAARVRRARERAESFRLAPYLDAQERFVEEARSVLARRA